MGTGNNRTAVWVITDNGLILSEKLIRSGLSFDLYISEKLESDLNALFRFNSLKEAVHANFHKYESHIFFMSTGITVRIIAEKIKSKLTDPAVLVIDDRGLNCISLLSGHIGGANKLCHKISEILDSRSIITTATDVNDLPAVDVIAVENDLVIENPEKIKIINSKILKKEPLKIYDPFGFIKNRFGGVDVKEESEKPDVVVDCKIKVYESDPLILRPKVLYSGLGCNRGTDKKDMEELLLQVLEKNKLSVSSLKSFATVDIKKDETGILELAKAMDLPIMYFSKDELNSVETFSGPSKMALKHVGVKSVCEAAAIMASKGKIVIPKQKTKDVTIAIAKIST